MCRRKYDLSPLWDEGLIYVLAVIAASIVLAFILSGCQRGDFKIEPVVHGQAAPFDGYTISPEIYATEGTPVQGTGVHIFIKGLDPNDVLDSVALREAGVR